MKTELPEKTVGQLVAEQPARARVFERHGIDYCCGGKVPLGEACKANGASLDEVLADLAQNDAGSSPPEVDWTKESMTKLCDHIEATHHAYLREALPRLVFLSEKVELAHGEHDPRLATLRGVVADFKEEIDAHAFKEEHILFPMIRSLDVSTSRPEFHCGNVGNPISVMVAEHDAAGAALVRMRELTDGYTAPPTACNTYRAMLHELSVLEADMHTHVHKENNILFPRAIAREGELA